MLILLLLAEQSIAQPMISWQNTYGGSGNDMGFCLRATPDSGFVATGVTFSADTTIAAYHGGGDVWVVKMNSTGNIDWERCYGGTGYEEGDCIQPVAGGGYIVAGYTSSRNGDITATLGGYDAWLVKLNDTGGIAWQRNYGGSGTDWFTSVQPTTDGGYIAAGMTTSVDADVTGYHGGAGYDWWVVKLNATGGIVWAKTFGGTSDDEAWSVQPTTDGGYVVAGYTSSNNGDVTGFHGGAADYWVVKLDAYGNKLWQHAYGGSGDDEAASVAVARTGGYIVTGNSNSTNGDVSGNLGGYDMWALRLNDTGGIIWKKGYGGSNDDNGESVIQTADSGFLLTGGTYSNNGEITGYQGHGDMWVVKTNAAGSVQWEKDAGGDSLDLGYSSVATLDGGYAVLGFTQSAGGEITYNHGASGTADFWLVKLMVKPEDVPTTHSEPERPLVFPVPTTGFVHVQLPDGWETAELTLWDLYGHQQDARMNGTGSKRTMDMTGLARGMYLLQIRHHGQLMTYEVEQQ